MTSYVLVIALWLGSQYVEFRVPVDDLKACHAYLVQRLKAPKELQDSVTFYCERQR